MSKHATRSPSGAAGWLACAGWTSDETGSRYANEGTAAHELAARCLTEGSDPARHLGLAIEVEGDTFIVDADMALAVGDYVGYVRDVANSTGGELLVEQRLPIQGITGEPDAHGTSDAVILAPGELIIADLKYGRGVPVEADGNPQLQIYALAAMDEFSLAHDFSTVRMVIHQPRLGAVSEWTQTVEQLEQFRAHVQQRIAIHDLNPEARNPGTKQCQWCASKATCSALRDEVLNEFEVVQPVAQAADDRLAQAMAKADLIEAWIKAVRAEVETRLLAGQPVPGFKLVQGKRGNRDKSRKDGRAVWCKSCQREKGAAWAERNRERTKAVAASWRSKNKERKAATDAAYAARIRRAPSTTSCTWRRQRSWRCTSTKALRWLMRKRASRSPDASSSASRPRP